jgi:GT2 family glycosyltransferase
MQIEVIDDASTENPQSVVQEVGGGRVAFCRHPQNVGLVRNMNACIERARGEWVHILHADDYVLDGFYTEVEALARQTPEPAVIALRCQYVDEAAATLGESLDFSEDPRGERLRREFLRGSPVQFAGMVVRRAAYESSGGFREDFSHVADVEMWSRLLFNHASAFSARCLCSYRIHSASDTSRLVQSGGNIRERSALLPFLTRHAGLSRAEADTYRSELHGFACGQCLRFTYSKQTKAFLRNLAAYAKSTVTPAEKVLFARRAAGMIIRHALHWLTGKSS